MNSLPQLLSLVLVTLTVVRGGGTPSVPDGTLQVTLTSTSGLPTARSPTVSFTLHASGQTSGPRAFSSAPTEPLWLLGTTGEPVTAQFSYTRKQDHTLVLVFWDGLGSSDANSGRPVAILRQVCPPSLPAPPLGCQT